MKKTKKGIFLLLFLCVSLVVFGQETDWKQLKTETYKIDYPSDWTSNQDGFMGVEFFLFAPKSSKKDKTQENLSFIKQNIGSTEMTLDEYVKLSENQINDMIEKSKILSNKRIKQDSLDFHEFIYHGKQGKSMFTFWQLFTVVGDEAYILTFAAGKKEFKKYKKVVSKIMASFELNEAALARERAKASIPINEEKSDEKWTYIDTETYELKYPSNWTLDENGGFGVSFTILSNTTSEKDLFRENITLVIQDMSMLGVDFDNEVELSEADIKEIVKDCKILKNEMTERYGLRFQEVVFSGKESGMNLTFYQLYTTFENKMYVMGFTSLQNTFDEYEAIATEILHSFTIKKM